MKKIVAMLLVSGDTIVGELKKRSKKKTVIKRPVRLTHDSKGDLPLMFIRHNLLGFLPKVTYRKESIVIMYPVSPYVSDFYDAAIKFLETSMNHNLETEFRQYTKVIEKNNTKKKPTAESEEFKQFMEDVEKAMNDPSSPTDIPKKRTIN